MLNRKKHGFTVVELVIVIAVIAILAAVLIPTFIGIVNSAKKSADTTLIRNLNTALKADKPDGPHATMTDALAAVEKSGYDVAKINKTMLEGHQIVWDSERGVFAYMDTTDPNNTTFEYVPDSDNYTALEKDEFYKYWVIASEPSTTFSTYLYNYKGDPVVTVPDGVGLDVGTATNITEVKYIGESGNTVVLYTHGGKLMVDAKNATVHHYGEAEQATITAVKNESYHEFGAVTILKISAGRAVVENSATVSALIATSRTVKVEVPKDSKTAIFAPEGTDVGEATNKGDPNNMKASDIGSGKEDDPYLIATPEQALKMNDAKGYFKLVADIVVTNEIYLSGKTFVLDLNGHTLKLEYAKGEKPNNGSVLSIGGKGGKLTINDSSAAQTGAVIGSDQTYPNKVTSAVRVNYSGRLTINGGHFYGMSEGTSCIFVCGSSATVVINGGTFETASPSNGTYFVLNHQDDITRYSKITVNGGKFKNYNPGVTTVDPVNAYTGKIVLGTGCTTTKEEVGSDTWYTVSK